MRSPWYLPLLPLLLACLLLSGCLKNKAQDTQQQAPQFTQTSEEQINDDIKIVRNVIIHKMRGLTTRLPAEIAFAPQGRHDVQEAGFNYKGFSYVGMGILSYAKRKKDNDTEENALLAALLFADATGRKTSATFAVRYEIGSKKFTITESAVRPLSFISPQILCFIVPQDAYTKAASKLTSYEAWLRFAVKNVVKQGTDAASAGPRKYTIIAVSMDRVLERGVFQMGLAPDENAPIASGQARFENYDGWQIGILDAELTLGNPNDKTHIRVDYTPEASIRPPDAQATYPVGIFAVQK